MPKHSKIYLILLLALCSLAPAALSAHRPLETDLQPYLSRFTETPPPNGPVRPIAEFEPASQVLIRYPLGIPVSLVAQLANTAQVVCIVASTSVQNSATNTFNNGGVNMANVSFLIAATDSYWTRDYGPWFIFDGGGNYGVVDFQYNRPRPNDNLIPQVFANQNSLTYYGMNLYQTGGNYMTDGINTAAQTTIAYSENSGQTQAQVNAKMQNYLGITSYHVLPDPNNTYIDHIDCWGKFLAPDKVLIRSVPSSHAQYNAIEQTAAYFANLNCAWGYPYKVYRVNTPQNQPYTNSLILNRKVFVPIMNSTYDAAALQVYQNALPGYEVIGVAGTGSAPWESTDALHCRTHEIPDQDMLFIGHMPYSGTETYSSSLPFTAEIKAHSGQAVLADSTYVRFKINGGGWQNAYLAWNNGDVYTTLVNGLAPGDTIRYFIHAADASGRAQDHPYFAALDPHVFIVAPDTEAPTILHGNVPATIASGEQWFSATVTDNIMVSNVVLRYRIDNGEPVEIPMMTDSEAPPNYWWADFELNFVSGQQNFYYQIEAWDNANPPNHAVYPWPGEWVSVPIEGVGVDDGLQPALEPEFLSVYPNPCSFAASTSLIIEYKSVVNLPLLLKFFNTKGQLLASETTNAPSSGVNRYAWSLPGGLRQRMASGVYFIQLTLGDKSLTRRILVLN